MNANNGKLSKNPIKREAKISYKVDNPNDKTQNAQFEFKFNEKTELTGHMKLKLWVQAEGNDDMDLFVVTDKINRTGDRVRFPMQSYFDNGSAAYGWLRVTHRELDEERSTPHQPFLKHEREMKLKEGEIVPVEIEIWPSSTLLKKGEKLRVTVLWSDIHVAPQWLHSDTVNEGEHIIHTGGKYDSHLLMPVIPPG